MPKFLAFYSVEFPFCNGKDQKRLYKTLEGQKKLYVHGEAIISSCKLYVRGTYGSSVGVLRENGVKQRAVGLTDSLHLIDIVSHTRHPLHHIWRYITEHNLS